MKVKSTEWNIIANGPLVESGWRSCPGIYAIDGGAMIYIVIYKTIGTGFRIRKKIFINMTSVPHLHTYNNDIHLPRVYSDSGTSFFFLFTQVVIHKVSIKSKNL